MLTPVGAQRAVAIIIIYVRGERAEGYSLGIEIPHLLGSWVHRLCYVI